MKILLMFLACLLIPLTMEGEDKIQPAESALEDPSKIVYEILGIQSVRIAWRGDRRKPTVVTTLEELIKIMPNRADVRTVRRQVDFEKQQLIIFAWEGDAQDRINVKSNGTNVNFIHWGNSPGNDPHLHCMIFALKKGVSHFATVDPDPR